jgi:hypothetical protein
MVSSQTVGTRLQSGRRALLLSRVASCRTDPEKYDRDTWKGVVAKPADVH